MHCPPPTVVHQAIEDAYVLTEVLKGVNSTAALPEALQDFYRRRVGRTTAVQLLSRLASDLIINAFDTPWSPHDDKGANWKSYLTFAWKPILQYLIFPLQFAYLYSYHPTGSMGDFPKELQRAWKARHQVPRPRRGSEPRRGGGSEPRRGGAAYPAEGGQRTPPRGGVAAPRGPSRGLCRESAAEAASPRGQCRVRAPPSPPSPPTTHTHTDVPTPTTAR